MTWKTNFLRQRNFVNDNVTHSNLAYKIFNPLATPTPSLYIHHPQFAYNYFILKIFIFLPISCWLRDFIFNVLGKILWKDLKILIFHMNCVWCLSFQATCFKIYCKFWQIFRSMCYKYLENNMKKKFSLNDLCCTD